MPQSEPLGDYHQCQASPSPTSPYTIPNAPLPEKRSVVDELVSVAQGLALNRPPRPPSQPRLANAVLASVPTNPPNRRSSCPSIPRTPSTPEIQRRDRSIRRSRSCSLPLRWSPYPPTFTSRMLPLPSLEVLPPKNQHDDHKTAKARLGLRRRFGLYSFEQQHELARWFNENVEKGEFFQFDGEHENIHVYWNAFSKEMVEKLERKVVGGGMGLIWKGKKRSGRRALADQDGLRREALGVP